MKKKKKIVILLMTGLGRVKERVKVGGRRGRRGTETEKKKGLDPEEAKRDVPRRRSIEAAATKPNRAPAAPLRG